jgi:hypothetical protein
MAYIGLFPSAVITTTAQIQDGAIQTQDIQDGAITQSKINSSVVLGGEVVSTTDAYKNYDTISSDATLNLASGKNYFLSGVITIANNITWTVSGSGTLTII